MFKSVRIIAKGNNKILLSSNKNKKFRKSSIIVQGENNIIKFGKNLNIKDFQLVINGNSNIITIEDNFKVHTGKIKIMGNNNILEIKKECQFWGAALFIEQDQGEVKIGNSIFNGTQLISGEKGNKLLIGNNNLFSNAIIRNTDGHKILKKEKQINKGKNIVIKDNIWIAANVIVLKGVKINSGNVISAGTIVTKDILEENSVIVGNPYRIIKENITWKF